MPWWRWRRTWRVRSKAMERGGWYRCLWPITNFNTRLQSKSPINPVAGLWGFYSLLLTRLLSHSVKIGHIPIYIGIKFNFVLCELDVRRILSSHNDLPWWTIRTRLFYYTTLHFCQSYRQPPFSRNPDWQTSHQISFYEKGKPIDCNPNWWGDNVFILANRVD